MTEPCPFCGARIIPIRWAGVKKCPACGRMWRESGGGMRNHGTGGGPSAGAGTTAQPMVATHFLCAG